MGKGLLLAEIGWAEGMDNYVGKSKLGLVEDCYSWDWNHYNIRNSGQKADI
jgi:hypothetical protein